MTDEADILAMVVELKAGQVKLAGIMTTVLDLLEEIEDRNVRADRRRQQNLEAQSRWRAKGRDERKVRSDTRKHYVSITGNDTQIAPVVGSLDAKEQRLKTKTKSKDSLLGLVSLRDFQHSVSDGFDAFWREYPRRVGKAAAAAIWKRLELSAVSGDVMLGLAREKKTEWRNRDLDKIPHPATWLNQRRWEDDREGAPDVAAKQGPDPNVEKFRLQREQWERENA